jgi:hypothetical protein
MTNSVELGRHVLAGLWDVDGLKCGIDVDTKKAKGADCPTSSDNGLDAAKFKVRGHLNSHHYAAFQKQFADLNPRRPGRERAPVPIFHPKTELVGIRNVRIVAFSIDSFSAKDGWRVYFDVHEWFDKPKAVKKKEDVKNVAGRAAPAQQILTSVDDVSVYPVYAGENPDGTPIYVPGFVAGRQKLSVLDYVAERERRDLPPPDTSSVDAIMGNLFNAGGPRQPR